MAGCCLNCADKRSIPVDRSGTVKNILVVLGCDPRSSKMIDFVLKAAIGLDVNIVLRPHPASPIDPDISSIRNISISRDDIETDIVNSDVVVYDLSKVALEALNLGKPVIHITFDNDVLLYDPIVLDCGFKWEADSSDMFMKAINSICSLTVDEYKERSVLAKDYAGKYLVEKSEKSLSAFII